MKPMTEPVLSVRDLRTVIHTANGVSEVVKGVSFDVARGETLALVGESGCGKSTTVLSVMDLHPRPTVEITGGQVVFEGVDLVKATEQQRRSVRGAGMAMVYQDPMTSLNPLMRVGDQIGEVVLAHGGSATEARRRVGEVLEEVGIADPGRAARAYPHEFSGGMRQRVVIAMALAMRPRLLIADEPTTALDVTIQQQIIALVGQLQADNGMAVVWITHDLGVVARVADRIAIMYAGHIVEEGSSRRVFAQPEHPYTDGLIASIPRPTGSERPPLRLIPGSPPDPSHVFAGCPFAPRCPQAVEICGEKFPPITERGASRARCWVPPEEWTAPRSGGVSQEVAR
jgi:oligopeptide/dipeptide ABC transporter ATP-binding protein